MADVPVISKMPNRAGRPKGSQNQSTKDFKEFWARFFSDPRYKRNLIRRIMTGNANHMELYISQLLYGKPKERIEGSVEHHFVRPDLTRLSADELEVLARLRRRVESGESE